MTVSAKHISVQWPCTTHLHSVSLNLSKGSPNQGSVFFPYLVSYVYISDNFLSVVVTLLLLDAFHLLPNLSLKSKILDLFCLNLCPWGRVFHSFSMLVFGCLLHKCPGLYVAPIDQLVNRVH